MIRSITRLLYRCSSKDKPFQMMSPQVQQTIKSTELMEAELAKRKHALIQLHSQSQKLIDSKLKFPIKLLGTMDKYAESFAYMPTRVLSYYKIPKSMITGYLLKMYKASLYAIADCNQPYMNEYWEEGLTEQILEVLSKAKNQYTIKVQQQNDFLDYFEESCEIVDAVMVRGLSTNRKENQKPQNYIKYAEDQEIGLVTYTPKFLTEDGQSFSDPKKNKTVYSGYEKMVMRILVRIRTPLRINIKQFEIDPTVDTREHLCIMQNEMVAPKHLQSAYKMESFMEWLGKYRFGMWKVADIDNFMCGNSLFRMHQQTQELDDVFKGTKLDKSSYIDIKIF